MIFAVNHFTATRNCNQVTQQSQVTSNICRKLRIMELKLGLVALYAIRYGNVDWVYSIALRDHIGHHHHNHDHNHHHHYLSQKGVRKQHKETFPLRTASFARWTQCWTLAEIQRYLKKRWCADQNWPHIVLRMRCSASIRFAAASNFSRASTHYSHMHTNDTWCSEPRDSKV